MNPPFDALADLRALVAAPNPDAPLLTACERFMLLHEEAHQLFRRKPRGGMQRIREVLNPEIEALEGEIARTAARTPAGRRAKGEAALSMIPSGGIFTLPRAALVDFLNNADMGEPL